MRLGLHNEYTYHEYTFQNKSWNTSQKIKYNFFLEISKPSYRNILKTHAYYYYYFSGVKIDLFLIYIYIYWKSLYHRDEMTAWPPLTR